MLRQLATAVCTVLLLIHGRNQDSVSAASVQDLEESIRQLSADNAALQQEKKDLTNLLWASIFKQAQTEHDLNYLQVRTDNWIVMFQLYERWLQEIKAELHICKMRSITQPHIDPQQPGIFNCGAMLLQMKARLELLESNLTQAKRIMTMEKDQIARERDKLNLETIHLRRDKSTLEKELELSKQSTKDQFSQLLASVSTVSKSLLEKIDSLFPEHLRFQITCPKQKEHLEQIQTNCTSLSREVENKLQYYMNIVGDKVSNMQNENNHLKAENWRLSEDYRWCSQNHTSMMDEHKRNRDEVQLKHDQEKERLLMDKMKLTEILKNSVKYKNAEMDILREQYIHLNMSCMARKELAGYSGEILGSRSNTQKQYGSGLLSGGGFSSSSPSSFTLGKSSTGAAWSGPSFSSGLFRATPSGAGSSTLTFQQSGSRSGLTGVGSGVNKPASTVGVFPNLGSYGSSFSPSWSRLNKPNSGRNSTSSGSPFGSLGSILNQKSNGTGLNKPTLGAKSSSSFGFGSSTSGTGPSSGSTSKTPSSGFSWLGLGSTNSGQSKRGSFQGRTSGADNSSGTTNRQDPGIAQQNKELQRLINPSGQQ